MKHIILSLGSNVGDRLEYLEMARELLDQKGVKTVRASSIYESEPVGYSDQDKFLNQVLIVETKQTPGELLKTALGIEQHMGRIRTFKNGPRTIDIDLLFYRDELMSEDHLLLPHPRIEDRRFVLVPLAELIPDEEHPVMGETIQGLLDECTDEHGVELFEK